MSSKESGANDNPAAQGPSSQPAAAADDPRLTSLFNRIEEEFRATELGPESWYILAIACVTTGPDPERAAQLYRHLCAQAGYATSEARQALVRRLREALIKSVSVIGVCKPIEAVVAISREERPEDRDYGCTREGWQAGPENRERGDAWIRRLYSHNTEGVLSLFDAHRDFAWLSKEITYGLYLSDRQVLGDVDTQLVVLPAIMSQNMPLETHWHIRGTRRIGVSRHDTEVIYRCVRLVADHFGVSLHKVPTVEQVEPDV